MIVTILCAILIALIIANVAMALYQERLIKQVKAEARETATLAEQLKEKSDNVISTYKHYSDEVTSENARLKTFLAKSERERKQLQDTIEPLKKENARLEDEKQQIETACRIMKGKLAAPAKSYLIKHLFSLYDIKSEQELAKALGVSKTAISRALKSK